MKRTLSTQDLLALMTGIMATLAGIGIARFAYTPLLPAIIQEGWFTASQGAYLGAANLLLFSSLGDGRKLRGYRAKLCALRRGGRFPLVLLLAVGLGGCWGHLDGRWPFAGAGCHAP